MQGSGHAIRQNRIFANDGLGIDLAGGASSVNENEIGDSDFGANDGQNYPVIFNAISGIYEPTSGQIRFRGRGLQLPVNAWVALLAAVVGLATALGRRHPVDRR